MSIHATAIVSKNAKLAHNVQIGPYSIIGDGVQLCAGVKIGTHCVIEGNTRIQEGTSIFTGSVIGSPPQDLKYKGEKSSLEIGRDNIIREYCTMNPGTKDGSRTVIGDNNLFMAYSHVAHDCHVGSHCVFANNGTLAGHVVVQDYVVLGGLAAAHQFVRIGKLAIVGGCSKVVQDIPPFSTCDGHPARLYGLNLVGLRRNGYGVDAVRHLKRAYAILFNSGLNVRHALERIEQEDLSLHRDVAYLVDFIRNSQRGISHSSRIDHASAEQPSPTASRL
jgi:UDP-N-acetylglucosamine acyltransferase